MQFNEETKLEQQSPDEGAASADAGLPAESAANLSKKKASKKKASKKKAGKKKVSKKKSSKKRKSKKRGKKKATRVAGDSSDNMARVLGAVEELRDAIQELASSEITQRRKAVEDLREAAREKIHDLETAAQSSLAKLTGKG